jgi:hypothetical protein
MSRSKTDPGIRIFSVIHLGYLGVTNVYLILVVLMGNMTWEVMVGELKRGDVQVNERTS